jgi:hypothetical protein
MDDVRVGNRYLQLVMLLLTGYAVFGRSFAAIGIHPLYIGEVVLALGIFAAMQAVYRSTLLDRIRTRFSDLTVMHRISLLIPFLSLAAFILWGFLRTLPFATQYGLVALRDAVIWGYSLFSVVVLILLFARPERIGWILRSYSRFVRIFLLLTPIIFILFWLAYDILPVIPGDYRPLLFIKYGDWLVHLAGITAYQIMLAPSMTPAWFIGMWLIATEFFFSSSINRGGFLAYISGLFVIVLFGIRRKRIGVLIGFIAALIVVFGGSGLWIEYRYHHREISLDQFVSNIASIGSIKLDLEHLPRRERSLEEILGIQTAILDQSPGAKVAGVGDPEIFFDPTLQDTVNFRLYLWRSIIKDVLQGDARLTGLGFGINLIDVAGYEALPYKELRSPHNIHVTILGRMGLIGFMLWTSLNASWVSLMLWLAVRSRRSGDLKQSAYFVFLIAYWTALLMNATWDVFLEGPMGGIWFWVVIGIGLAMAALYQSGQSVDEQDATGRMA